MQQSYRTTDPESSRMASASVDRVRYLRTQKAFEAVKMFPNRTAAELYSLTQGMNSYNKLFPDSSEFNRRLSDAKNSKLIQMGKNRKCTVKGTHCHEWEPSSGC